MNTPGNADWMPDFEDPEKPAAPVVFPISTLRDIFNLPTFEQMETCLRELTEGMIQARMANDAMVALARLAGGNIERAVEWPEVANWTDDGKCEIKSTFHGDGMPTISVVTKINPESEQSN